MLIIFGQTGTVIFMRNGSNYLVVVFLRDGCSVELYEIKASESTTDNVCVGVKLKQDLRLDLMSDVIQQRTLLSPAKTETPSI